jgi:hypothetical protein
VCTVAIGSLIRPVHDSLDWGIASQFTNFPLLKPLTLTSFTCVLLSLQVPTGLEIVGKVFEFTSWP